MSVLFSMSVEYMRKQKKRTVLTGIGIMLGCALVCAIGIFFTSVQNMLLVDAEYSYGSHHYQIGLNGDYLTKEQAEKLTANHFVSASGLLIEDEISPLASSAESEDQQQHSLTLIQRDAGAMNLKKYQLTQGRLPQNDQECLISTSALERLPKVCDIGDTLTLPIQHLEDSEQLDTRTLTITGIYEDYQSVLVTYPNDAPYHHYSLLVQLDTHVNQQQAISAMLEDAGLADTIPYSTNDGYLRYMGLGSDNNLTTAFFTTFILLAIIILTAMVLVIKNSFAMSTSEKISEFGVLRCVGASPKQIRSIVLYEALTTWAVSLPLGLLLAIGAMALTIWVVSTLDVAMLNYLTLSLSPWPFVVTAILSFVAVMLSAYAPAKKAGAISPISAVRGSASFVDVPSRIEKKGWLAQKAFGFSGILASRNIHRNKKRYRTTIFSIIISVALFVSLSGFAMAMQNTANTLGEVAGTDFQIIGSLTAKDGMYNIYELLQSDQRVDKLAQYSYSYFNLPVEADKVEESSFQVLEQYPDLENILYFSQPPEEYHGLVDPLEKVQVYSPESTMAMGFCVDRQTYEQLELAPGSMTYDQLVESKECALLQTSILSSATSLIHVSLADYQIGDMIYPIVDLVAQDAQPDEYGSFSPEQQSQAYYPVKIGAVVEEVPWFISNNMAGFVFFIPEENQDLFSLPQGTLPLNSAYDDSSEIAPHFSNVFEASSIDLHVKSVSGQEEQLDSLISRKVREENVSLGQGDASGNTRISSYNLYEAYKDSRNRVLVINIFLYGFLAVVMIICIINVFNTVSTNIMNRKREIAMLGAIGTSKRQLRKMLYAECLLYGLIGTIWGAIIGLLLQALLIWSVSQGFDSSMVNPLVSIVASFIGILLLSFLAGIGPIRRILKGSIVEEIRSQE